MRLFDESHDPAWPPDPETLDLNDPDFVTPQQAAALARISERTLWRWLSERPIALKVGGRVYVSRRRLFGQ